MRLDSILGAGFWHGEEQQWGRLGRASVAVCTAGSSSAAGGDGQGGRPL